GDGINDAPALVRADVGVAISNGTDISFEIAAIILMKNDLLDLVSAIRLSKAVIKNIKENLFWAFFYNVLGIPLAAGVLYNAFGIKLNPMFGAAAMSFSSIFVVTNALRLKYFKPDKADKITAGNETDNNELNINSNKYQNEKEKKDMITLKVEGMMCMHCVSHVEEALNKLEGVSAKANLETKEVAVENSKNLDVDLLINAVKEAGYEAVAE
ncbi:MAG: cation transporter, partial [Lachnospiraceae bacterium]|nr:cation transporter [Lachnospiraceae bacterium]